MKISLLQKREEFYRIFEDTVSRFLSELVGNDIRVKWGGSFDQSGQLWYCNPLINSIFVKNVNPCVFDSLKGEYSNNPFSLWKTLLQRLYLWFSMHPFFAHHLAFSRILINTKLDNSQNLLFIGGNTKIRLIDINNQLVYVILKDGYNDTYMNSELAVRENNKFLPAPQILKVSPKNKWYAEEYVNGISPDRLKSGGEDVINKAVINLHCLYMKTVKTTTKEDYLNHIAKSIKINVDSIPKDNNFDFIRLKRVLDNFYNILLSKLPPFISLCQNHGDFQPGNILWDEEKTKLWVVDWEYTRERQYGFDFFVLLLSARSKSGIKNILSFKANDIIEEKHYLVRLYKNLDMNNLSTIFQLFLLEELDFKIEEYTNTQHKQYYNYSLVNYINCMESVLQGQQFHEEHLLY